MNFNRTPIPEWAHPYIAALLASIALAFMFNAYRWSRRKQYQPEKRWGNTAGLLGAAICAATLASLAAFKLDLMPIPFTIFTIGLVTAGIAGSFAGWNR